MKSRIAIIFLIVFVDLLGFGIVIPILPMYAEKGFGASDFMTGLLVASFSFMQLLFTPVWGRVSDRIGRKPVLVIGLAFSSVAYVVFGLAGSLTVLFLARILAGIGGANISAAQACIADVTTVEERVKGMGILGAAFGLGFAFGPFLGGTLSSYGYQYPGFAASALSALSLVLTLLFLPETRSTEVRVQRTARFSLREVVLTLRRPKIGILLLLMFLAIFAYANIYATFPILAHKEFGFSERQVGYLFGFMGLMGAITQGGLIRPLSRRLDERMMFLAGCIMTMIGLTLLPFYVGTWELIVVLIILSVGTGITNPTILSLISRNTPAGEQGGTLGIGQSLSALGRVLGPVWGGLVFQSIGHVTPFITGGAVMGLAILIAIWHFRSGIS